MGEAQAPASMRIDQIVKDLTTHEKISLLSGVDFWHTAPVPRHAIPSIRMSDGPNGVRGTKFFDSVPAACLPCGTALGATWDRELLERAGHLIARECVSKGVHAWLGPTVNIQRNPLGGRGFESFSEDPVLSGLLAASVIRGVQAKGIASVMKHFVANDMEHERTAVDCIIKERALREIYLLPFQIAVREAQPWAMMTAYNKVNGVHMSENKRLLEGVLRREWGWDGLLTSDWYGTYSTCEAIEAGLDIEMPGPSRWRGSLLANAQSVSKVSQKCLDRRVESMLKFVSRVSTAGIPENGLETASDTLQTAEDLRVFSRDSIVMLKNENNLLPLSNGRSTAVIGPNARVARYCGGGSAALRPYRAPSILESVERLTQYASYAEGCQSHAMLPVLGHLLSTSTGRKGYFTFNVYNQPLGDQPEPIDTLELDNTDIVLFDYKNPQVRDDVLYASLEADLSVDRSGDYCFGLTVSGTARLYVDDELLVDNWTSQIRGESFFGSGTIEVRAQRSLEARRKYKFRVHFGSAPTSGCTKQGAPVFGPGGLRIGCSRMSNPERDIAEAVEVARNADQVILCCGLNGDWESEGFDRQDMDLPGPQARLIAEVCRVNPRTVLVIQSGTPVAAPWRTIPAIIQAWYGGNACGEAIVDVLFGAANPGGKLPLSWPLQIEDCPAFLSHRSDEGRCSYGDNVFVGYRGYEKMKRQVQWPFGFGMSYSRFEIHDLTLTSQASTTEDFLNTTLVASVGVSNKSDVDGSEVVQLYVSGPETSRVSRAVKELKGFEKMSIKARSTATARITLSIKHAFSFWSEREAEWIVEEGVYRLSVGTSSADTPLMTTFVLENSYAWSGI